MSVISIKYGDIPLWLQAGEFYRSLDADDQEGIIDIPTQCFPTGSKFWKEMITTQGARDDICHLLRVTLFWMLDDIPRAVLFFCMHNTSEIWQKEIASVPNAKESNILSILCEVFSSANVVQLDVIMRIKRWDIAVHVIDWIPKKEHLNVHCYAARSGYLIALKHFHEQGLEWHVQTCAAASWSGHVDCLQYARENGCSWNGTAVRHAAQEGHLSCLQYLLEQGCPIHIEACNMACKHGHLACLQLLHAYNAPWNAATSCHAAFSSNVASLQYVHENGCPWDTRTPYVAAEAGNLDALRYALTQGCPLNTLHVLQIAAEGGHVVCVQYLIQERGVALTKRAFAGAMWKGHLPCVKYMLTTDYPLHFTDLLLTADDQQYARSVFVKNSASFIECIKYAVQHRWIMSRLFADFVYTHDCDNCKELMTPLGWFVDDWVGGVRVRQPAPAVRVARGEVTAMVCILVTLLLLIFFVMGVVSIVNHET